MIKTFLSNLVEINNTKSSKIFNITIQVIIVLSVINFSIETIPDLESDTIKFLKYFELFSIIIFTIEYILRIYVANKKLSYIFSFYGIIDLLAILPYYLSIFIDFRSIKIFRFFSLFRLLKLTRYHQTLDRLKEAFSNVKEEFIIFFIFTIITLYLASIGIYYFENQAQPEVFRSIFDSMWWAVATLTTVGYGDVYPITVGGKIFTTIILLIGLGVVGIPAGIVASALSEIQKSKRKNRDKKEKN